VEWSNKGVAKIFLLPGGVCIAATAILLNWRLLPLAPSAIHFYYYAVFLSGALLAWRFRSSKVLFSLLTLFLGHRALEFFFSGRAASPAGHTALEAVSILLPLNFVLFSASRERGINNSGSLARLCLLFLEATFVAILCRPGASPAFFREPLLGKHWQHWTGIPSLGAIVALAALAFLLTQLWLYRKPVDSGLFWSLLGVLLAFHRGSFTLSASVYIATAALVLTVSVIENSYVLAYHDELTGIAARRAFNDAVLELQEPYVIAAIDIDHFKSFNDTYGHETGDQVLRMVASCLARVEGGGRPYRVGGEEFSILFPRKSLQEVLPHLENLRANVENTVFRVRGGHERRGTPHGTDRRRPAMRKKTSPKRPSLVDFNREIGVTISLGVAEPAARFRGTENVIRAADKALYRAKEAGRNRIVSANATRTRVIRTTSGRSA
jgi:diguanylate cyclase (GGDEF)-like protein